MSMRRINLVGHPTKDGFGEHWEGKDLLGGSLNSSSLCPSALPAQATSSSHRILELEAILENTQASPKSCGKGLVQGHVVSS